MQLKSLAFSVGSALLLAWFCQGALKTAKTVGRESGPIAAVVTPAAAGAPAAIAVHADPLGHFHMQAVIDGRSLPMVVDTGASLCAFSEEDAERIGIRVKPGDFTRTVGTANGTVRVAPIRIGIIQIGPIAIRDVEAVVIQRGRLGTNLLGMSFLKRLRDFSMAGGRLTLRG